MRQTVPAFMRVSIVAIAKEAFVASITACASTVLDYATKVESVAKRGHDYRVAAGSAGRSNLIECRNLRLERGENAVVAPIGISSVGLVAST